MNKRRFTLIAFVAMFAVMFFLPMGMVPTLNTTSGAPMTQDEIDRFGETLPNGTLYYPDLEFPTRSYLPSAEGTLHEDSILEFRETTDDDVLFYPDAFEEALAFPSSGDSGVSPVGTLDKTHVDDGDDYSARTSLSGDAWVTTNFTALAPIEFFYYNIEGWGAGGSTAFLYVYDWTADAWVSLNAVSTTTPTWYSGTLHDSDYWSGSEISLKIESFSAGINWAAMDYAAVTFTVMHLADSDHYAESFADVSDWTLIADQTTFTTDGDVGSIEAGNNGGDDWDVAYCTTPDLSSSNLYFEIRYRMNTTDINYIYMYSYTGDYTGDITLQQALQIDTSWRTIKWKSLSSIIGSVHFTIRTSASKSGPVNFEIEYLRVGAPDEMGYQYDGSSTVVINHEGSVGYTQTASTDNDILTLTWVSDGSNVDVMCWSEIDIDPTTTDAMIELDYYPFLELKWRVTTADSGTKFGSWQTYTDGIKHTENSLTDYGETTSWAINRANMKADTDVSSGNSIRFYPTFPVSSTKTFVLEIDWTGFYSIANWSISQVASMPTDTYMYVDGNNLVRIGTHVTGYYFSMTYDAGLNVNTNTFNVWNLTISGLGSSYPIAYGFRGYINSVWDSLVYDEPRGVPSAGTLTNIQFYSYDEFTLSAIKFWEDAVAPTIEEKWSTPQDPDTGDDVTISIVTTDVVGVYEATAVPLTEPSGSSIGTKTFTLVDTNPSGAMFWKTTIDSADLIAGNYVFEIEATDAANSDYEYLTFTVIQETQTKYIRIFDSLGDFVPFETFEVYRNGSRQYTDVFEGENGYAYQIQVKDRWGESLNTTTFAAGVQELVVTIEVYSLKIMSWHDDFIRFNITRAGLTYSEIVTPLEIVNFRLYTNTYDWEIDYLNGTSTAGNIALTNSTALIVTGSTISDVFGLVTTVNEMTTAINITTTTISNEVVTIQLMFDWTNTTLYDQTITIIAAFDWDNTTLYNQTISIAAAFNATNTVLYDQIILIQNMFNWENTTLYNQTLSILNAFNSTNTVIYSQTVSILADISNVNSTIYAQTVQMLLDLENSNSTLYSQTVTLLANVANIDSDIAAQTVTILADIENINSTIYAQTVQMLLDLENMNSTIYTQTITILSDLSALNATFYLVEDPTHLNPLVLGYSLSDDYCDFTIVTNWHNASISIYDNNVLRTGPTSELLCPIRYPLLDTSGTHNLSVYVDAGSDSFWYNISYTVAEIIAFEIEDWDITPHLSIENYLECFFDTTWGNSTIYVYLNGTLQASVLEQEGGISFSFWMSGLSGLHNYVFNVTSGANVKTITWDFYLPDWAETALVVRWDMWTYQNNYTLLTLESNWRNCTYHIYLDGFEVANATVDPVTLNFTRSINVGEYNLTIFADGGTQNYTILNIRYIVTEDGVTYDYSEVTTSHGVSNTYETNNYATYENPTGVYVGAETIALIIVGLLLGSVVLYMIVSRWLAVWRAKFSTKYT